MNEVVESVESFDANELPDANNIGVNLSDLVTIPDDPKVFSVEDGMDNMETWIDANWLSEDIKSEVETFMNDIDENTDLSTLLGYEGSSVVDLKGNEVSNTMGALRVPSLFKDWFIQREEVLKTTVGSFEWYEDNVNMNKKYIVWNLIVGKFNAIHQSKEKEVNSEKEKILENNEITWVELKNNDLIDLDWNWPWNPIKLSSLITIIGPDVFLKNNFSLNYVDTESILYDIERNDDDNITSRTKKWYSKKDGSQAIINSKYYDIKEDWTITPVEGVNAFGSRFNSIGEISTYDEDGKLSNPTNYVDQVNYITTKRVKINEDIPAGWEIYDVDTSDIDFDEITDGINFVPLSTKANYDSPWSIDTSWFIINNNVIKKWNVECIISPDMELSPDSDGNKELRLRRTISFVDQAVKWWFSGIINAFVDKWSYNEQEYDPAKKWYIAEYEWPKENKTWEPENIWNKIGETGYEEFGW